MSSPITIPATNSNSQSAHSPSMGARSLPGNANGLYVPVHRRGASTSSTSSSHSGSFFERGSLSSISRPMNPRTRSVSPMPRSPRSPRAFGNRHLDVSPAPGPSPRAANIPLALMIPNTYTIAELLALSSTPARLSPPQCAQLDAHIPLMTRKPKSSSPSSAHSSSASSSPTSTIAPLPAPAPAPVPATKSNQNPDVQKTRRRRPGRKNSGGKPRLAPALGTDVEERRRRHGANWGWVAHAGAGNAPEQENWRSHAVVVAA